MTTPRAALSAFALALVLAAGCGPTSPTSAPVPPPPKEKDSGVHIQTPGRDIDIKTKGTTDGDHKVDVNVTTKR